MLWNRAKAREMKKARKASRSSGWMRAHTQTSVEERGRLFREEKFRRQSTFALFPSHCMSLDGKGETKKEKLQIVPPSTYGNFHGQGLFQPFFIQPFGAYCTNSSVKVWVVVLCYFKCKLIVSTLCHVDFRINPTCNMCIR